ncbi:MAG TPA: FliI/YscN family ATPase [Acidobacteriota bacterium]|nr:FliI/YscN family ATPase [Acidobacteriota bacterium]
MRESRNSSSESSKVSSANSDRLDIEQLRSILELLDPLPVEGRVRRADGLTIESDGPPVSVGELCRIVGPDRECRVEVEVIGFKDEKILSMPIYNTEGIRLGDRVMALGRKAAVPVSAAYLGRVVDGNGRPLDGKGPILALDEYPLVRYGQNPLHRKDIDRALGTGVRAIDGLLTVGRGQRIGIFGGSGVGKSTLLGMMARNTEATVSVIGLVGERSREVNAFIQDDLGEEGLRKSVVVVSTSDNPPLMRIRAAQVATTLAEYFKDQGHHVLFVMDSVTRVAMAQREIGLAAGEPPSSKGYTPSVFSLLPRLFERAGNFGSGSITGFYTVLVEGDDMNEPISDAVRGLLDGHIVLSRELAWKNHFPAVDVLQSLSRLMPKLVGKEQLQAAAWVRELLSTYQEAEDLINIGAYHRGANPRIDLAVRMREQINQYLCQQVSERVDFQTAVIDLLTLASQAS